MYKTWIPLARADPSMGQKQIHFDSEGTKNKTHYFSTEEAEKIRK